MSAHRLGFLRTIPTAALTLALFSPSGVAPVDTDARTDGARSAGATREFTAEPCRSSADDSVELANLCETTGGEVTAVIVELEADPGVIRRIASEYAGTPMSTGDLVGYAEQLVGMQDAFLASLPGMGIEAVLRETDVEQVDGSVRHIEYRLTYLLNGFVAYVATEDLDELEALPEVSYVGEPAVAEPMMNNAIPYVLGTQPALADRREAVYGPSELLGPEGAPGHPEAPYLERDDDGFEGQGMNIAVIDTGVDYRHPMFGGTGNDTPAPPVSGASSVPGADNQKVIYYYVLDPTFAAGDPFDDFGHGTLVASNAAGYYVDGETQSHFGYGLGTNPPDGIGPTPNGVELFGTAPQARIMGYKVCNIAGTCPGDIEIAIEDAASPYTLTPGGVNTGVPKPVADVINLSLGDAAGNPAGSTSRAANNAALAGTIVVASAGNRGARGTIGAPSAATLAISVAATLDPGSIAAGDVLLEPEVPGTAPGASPAEPETGAESTANAPDPDERQAMKLFPIAGGGQLPDGSLSAHYVYVGCPSRQPTPPPAAVRGRIALAKCTVPTAFFETTNAMDAAGAAAVLIVTTVESATALVVPGGVPAYTIGPDNGNYLIDLMPPTEGDGNDDVDVEVGTISSHPLRIAEKPTLETFEPDMAGFSSRGPNDHPNAAHRVIKPDVGAPGVAILGAATPDGLPSETVGLADTTGYVQASGTSFAGPITAGAMALIRQRVSEDLRLDCTDLDNPDYRARRFDAVTVSRALLMNAATNLRGGLGVPQADPAPTSINDIGAGLIDVAGALEADAIMVSPTVLLADPAEYTPNPDAGIPAGGINVLIPSASFGEVPVVGFDGTLVRTREVIIRDVTGGNGRGVYDLEFIEDDIVDEDDVEFEDDIADGTITDPGFDVSFTADAEGNTPITSVTVPSGGQVSFYVRVEADGALIDADPTEFMWYVRATHASHTPGGAQDLRMPFYYLAVEGDPQEPAPSPGAALPIPTGEPCPAPGAAEPTPTPTVTPSPSPTPTPTGTATPDDGAAGTGRSPTPSPLVRFIPDTAGAWAETIGMGASLLLLIGSVAILSAGRLRSRRSPRR